MNRKPITFDGCVDIVIPAYGEPGAALEATLDGCLRRFRPSRRSSSSTIARRFPPASRAHHDRRQSATMAHAGKPRHRCGPKFCDRSLHRLVGCLHQLRSLPAPDWLQSCSRHLYEHPRVAACFSRMVPHNPKRLLSRWRMRFQETTSAIAPARRRRPATLSCFAGKRWTASPHTTSVFGASARIVISASA